MFYSLCSMLEKTNIIHGYKGTLQELWTSIADLDYDSIVELFGILQTNFADERNLVSDELTTTIIKKHIQQISEKLSLLLSNDLEPLADTCHHYNKIHNIHQRTLDKYNYSFDTLWQNIRNLEYSMLIELFQVLADKFQQDAQADLARWRPKIAAWISSIRHSLQHIINKHLQPLSQS